MTFDEYQDQKEEYEERAAIMEFCGDMTKAEAEAEALKLMRGKYGPKFSITNR